jgi:hypothetical protein
LIFEPGKVRLHGVSKTIDSDRGGEFVLKFGESLKSALGK